jgi:hypothetical protein
LRLVRCDGQALSDSDVTTDPLISHETRL